MNEILDEGLKLHPLGEQQTSVMNWRQTGIGVMGVADMLIKMGVRYGSDESLQICHDIAYCILNSAVYASANLAAYNKASFPMYDFDKLCKSKFYQQNISAKNKEYVAAHGMYNSQLLTIAPTGTLSTMLGISGGMEPIFANYYERKTESLYGEDRYYKVYTPIVKTYMEKQGIKDDNDLPDYFVTSEDISPIDRIKMQSVWQQYIDASISSTVNLPNDATVEDVESIYLNAAEYGLKGITVFRSGCRRTGILTTNNDNAKDTTNSTFELPRGYILDASDNLIGKKRKLVTGCGSLHCTAFFDPVTGDLMETYLSKGSTGGCNNFMIGLSRMISLSARGGVGIQSIVDQLNSSGACPSYAVRHATKHDTSPGSCCPVAIGKALMEMWREMQEEIGEDDETEQPPKEIVKSSPIVVNNPTPFIADDSAIRCPECGEPLVHEGGCDCCKNCGYSKCN